MASTKPRHPTQFEYDEAAQAYLKSLPLEHFMEAKAQATQHAITLVCLALICAQRPDLHWFNEMLVQYPPRKKGQKLGQVVPDNMVVRWDGEIKASGSYNVPLQPIGPFWVLEYVSKESKRKDYDTNFQKYEKDLKVPYYLIFYPDNAEMTLYQHTGRKYRTVKPNENGRYPIPELELELAVLEGWVRFWYKGKLLPLPAEWQRDQEATERRAREAEQQAKEAQEQAKQASRREQEAEQREQEAERRAAEERRKREEVERKLAQLLAQQGQPGERPGNAS